MVESIQSKNTSRWLWLAGVVAVCFFAGIEIRRFFVIEQNWGKLLSFSGLITIVAYIFLLTWGLIGLLFNSFRLNWLERWSHLIEHYQILRWLVIAGLHLSVVWFYLYSPWQAVWPDLWIQFLFAAGITVWLAWLASPDQGLRFGLSELMVALSLFLYPRLVLEARTISVLSAVYRSVTLLGYVYLLLLVVILYSPVGRQIAQFMLSKRSQLDRWRFVLVAILLVFPLALRFAPFLSLNGFVPNIRFAILLTILWAIAFLIGGQSKHVVAEKDLLIALLALALSGGVNFYLLGVVNYPFSLTWSEGNRFYDYSLVFGQALYQYKGVIVNPYSSPGRYGLWGILFLIQGLPIWFHRLWDALIRSILPIVLGWVLSRHIEQKIIRLIFFLWVSVFFMVLSPVHPPFVLALIVALVFGFESSLPVRVVSLFIASFYAGLSRWTWVVAPASWGVLVDLLLFYPGRKGDFWQRLKPTFFLLAMGLMPGLIINLGTFFKVTSGESLTLNQPLLWYRLLPNPTYPLGVGPSILLATGPLLVILTWWLASKLWKTDWLQKLAICGVLISFLVVGLIISAKIGGGGDLHNLDMYLAALFLTTSLGVTSLSRNNNFHPETWPVWIQSMLGLLLFASVALFTPFSTFTNDSPADNLPSSAETVQGLNVIQENISKSLPHGEVLFMDQRQLLAFGYIKPIPFVPDYEKKYMMDQAMGNNAGYFVNYYRDLAQARFSLIITEPLTLRVEGQASAPFSEENDAWVKWISGPTLCFYKPIYTDKANNFQLLVPNSYIDQCSKYLTGE